MDFINRIPADVLHLLLSGLFSLLIGLEQRRLHANEPSGTLFGTDRTFAFIGVLGFILFQLDPTEWRLFMGGGFLIGLWLSVYYFQRSRELSHMGITSLVVAMITYSIGPCVVLLPSSMVLILVIGILVLTEMKGYFKGLISKTADDEFITLAKFLAMAGVILPIVPDTPIPGFEQLSMYKLFLAVVVISGISYLSYLIRKFIFPKSGEEISGALAGFYSSTAATIVLSRQSQSIAGSSVSNAVGILLANTAMLIRIAILVLIFNQELAISLIPYLLGMTFTASLAAYILFKRKINQNEDSIPAPVTLSNNPLELKVALVFSGLYLLFSLVSQYSLTLFGASGLNILAVIVGFTDIDPFLMNVFQGQFENPVNSLVTSCLLAIFSNNILKTIYIRVWASENVKKLALPRMFVLIGVSLFCILINLFI
jgi:uncharacterized membrane protein (DUF4010 family)